MQCVSYTPFRRQQSPLEAFTVSRQHLEQDFALLAKYFSCARIYSVHGMHDIPAVARAHGMTLIAGAWLNRDARANEAELGALIRMANANPDVIQAVVVGNEVLLRREQSAAQMIAYLRRVKAAVRQPVTYADVWDFWLQNPQIAVAVDFITIHLLPYWEDDPSGIDEAIAAVEHAHAEITRAFPGRSILIGETGWPSQGRQREDAVPSRVNQALFLRSFVAVAERNGWRYNLIEAFDQPWKRRLEGAVGGYWGVFDTNRVDKNVLGGAVSNLPRWWLWLASSLGIAAALLCAGAWRVPSAIAIAFAAANLSASQLQMATLASRDWQEALWQLLMCGTGLSLGLAWARERAGHARPPWVERAVLLLAGFAAAEMLRLAFDPRYRDFPIAVFAIPACALVAWRREQMVLMPAHRVLGALIVLCLPAILWQETLRNTQALAMITVMLLLASGLLHRSQPRT